MHPSEATRADRRQLARDNAKQPPVLTLIPRAEWDGRAPEDVIEVWRSRDFFVQVYAESAGVERLSVVRSIITGVRFADGISWDELQRIKRECGRGDKHAVEIYPADRDVVNVASMRHLWILPEPLPFAWRRRR